MVAAGMGISIANPLVTASFGYLGIQERAFAPEIVFPTYVVLPGGTPAGMLAKAFADVFIKRARMRR
jgi:hypothetical protein